MLPNPSVQLLADFVAGDVSVRQTLLRMKTSRESHLFSGILGYRYANGVDLKRDLGGWVQSEGQAYTYANRYHANAVGIIDTWAEYLDDPINLGLFKTQSMRQRIRQFNKSLRSYQLPHRKKPWIFRHYQLSTPLHSTGQEGLELSDEELKQEILNLIHDHALNHEERKRIIQVQEDFLFTPKRAEHCGRHCQSGCSCRTIHWANVFELNRMINFVRFIVVFGEMFIETSLIAIQQLTAPATAVMNLFPNAAWLLTFANHIGFTNLGFSIYICQIALMTAEYTKLCIDIYRSLRATGMDKFPAVLYAIRDGARNYWLKPGKLSAFVNAAAWMSMGLIATFGFPAFGPLIFVIGFWFDVAHGLFWLGHAIFENQRASKQRRKDELRAIYNAENIEQPFDEWFKRLQTAVRKSLDTSIFPESAVSVMRDYEKSRTAWIKGIRSELISVAIAVLLAAGFTMAVFCSPIAAAVGTGVMFLTMVVFVVQKYYGFYVNRQREKHRMDVDEKGHSEESDAFRTSRNIFKREKDEHRHCFFNRCKHKSVADAHPGQGYAPLIEGEDADLGMELALPAAVAAH